MRVPTFQTRGTGFGLNHDAVLNLLRLPPIISAMDEFVVKPDPDDPRLTRRVAGIDQEGRPIETSVVTERPLTLFLNGREIVTMMTIGDHPEYLAVGYLLNHNMLGPDDRIIRVEYDDE